MSAPGQVETASARTLIVGVLNVTPDSFSDGGRFASEGAAARAGRELAAAGADWIDVGGESTRPDSVPVDPTEEQARVLPVIRALSRELPAGARISIDTYHAATARAAVAAGATVVNDISGGLLEPEILEVAAAGRAAVVLGHLRGRPATMMRSVAFQDVVAEVIGELQARIQAARAAGCVEIWADPGIGFGKHLEHNLALLRATSRLAAELRVPVLIGVSRKRFIGELTGRAEPRQRLPGTAGAVAAAVLGGAAAVRVHDVSEMVDVVRVAEAIRGALPWPAPHA